MNTSMTNLKKHLESLFLVFAILIMSISSASAKKMVVICTGPSAYAYHSGENCRGLNRCSAEIKTIILEEAERIGRKPCRICGGTPFEVADQPEARNRNKIKLQKGLYLNTGTSQLQAPAQKQFTMKIRKRALKK